MAVWPLVFTNLFPLAALSGSTFTQPTSVRAAKDVNATSAIELKTTIHCHVRARISPPSVREISEGLLVTRRANRRQTLSGVSPSTCDPTSAGSCPRILTFA